MELKRVVITGIGAISPLGATARETWEAVVAGKSGAGPITLFDASKFKTTFACEVKEFDVSKYIDKKEAPLRSLCSVCHGGSRREYRRFQA